MSRSNRRKRYQRVLPFGTRLPQPTKKRKINELEYELLCTEHHDTRTLMKDHDWESFHQLQKSHAAVEQFRSEKTSAEIP